MAAADKSKSSSVTTVDYAGAGRPWAAGETLPRANRNQALTGISTASDCPQRPAYSLQSLAEHFRIHSHADTEVIGQTEKMSRHG